MLKAYTDEFLRELGDWDFKGIRTMREVTLTRFDGHRTAYGVIQGTTVKLPITRVFKDKDYGKLKRSELLKLLYTEVI